MSDTANPPSTPTRTVEPDDWYVVTGQTVAHRAGTIPADTLNPWCSQAVTAAADTRPPGQDDTVCARCVTELLDTAVDVELPLPQCLGCGTLRDPDDTPDVPWHLAAGVDGACPGSGMRPAAHDGRDDVRREALRHRARVLDRIQGHLRHVANTRPRIAAIAGDDSADGGFTRAFGSHGPTILRAEGELAMWDDLLAGGDYLATTALALHRHARRHSHGSRLGDAVEEAVDQGAADWLRGNRPQIGARLADAPVTTLASMLEDLMP